MSLSTAARPTSSPAGPAAGRKTVTDPQQSFAAIAELVESRIAEAQSALWWAELTRAALQTLLGACAGVLLWVVLDQWVYSPAILIRLLLFIVWLGWIGWMIFTRIVPVLNGTICPAYASRSLERDAPEMRQELTSYIMLADQQTDTGLRGNVIRSIGAHAASRLRKNNALPREATGTMVWWLATAAMLALFFVYAVASPKSTLQSASRFVMPAASIAPARRVAITDVEPGDAEVMAGRNVLISAKVTGLKENQQVLCHWSVGDQTRETELVWDEKADRFASELSLDFASIGHASNGDVIYHLTAGDGVAGPFRLSVDDVPVVAVESVYYQPPSYIAKPPHSLTSPVIRGLDGTIVTIRAKTNRKVARAMIQFNPKPLGSSVQATAGVTEMQLDETGTVAKVSFPLRDVRGRSAAVQLESYRIQVEDRAGQTNPDPIVYPIDVIPDLAPEVTIVMPQQTPKDVPIDAQQVIEVHAGDADFGLSRIELEVRRGIDVLSRPILWEDKVGAKGNQVAEYRFRPLEHFLREGDAVEIVAIATDKRSAENDPLVEPNVTRTGPIVLRIMQSEPLSDEERGNDGMSAVDDKPAADNQPKQQEGGEQGGGSSGSGGEAATQQKSDQQEGGQQGSGQQQDGQQQDDQQKDGQQPDGQQQDGQQQDGQQQDGQQQDGQQQDGQQQDGQMQDGQQQDGQQQDTRGKSSGSNSQSDRPSESENQPQAEPPKHDGEAFERIRDYLNEKKQSPENAGEPGDQNTENQGSSSKTGKNPKDKNEQGSQGNDQPDKKGLGEKQDGQQSGQADSESNDPSSENVNANQQMTEDSTGAKKPENAEDQSQTKANEETASPNDAAMDESENGDAQVDESQSGESQDSEGQDGEGQDGEGQDGEGQDGEGQDGEGQDGEGQDGEGQDSEGQDGEGQGSEGQDSEAKGSESQGSESKSDDTQGSESEASPRDASNSRQPNSEQTPPSSDDSSTPSQGSSGTGTGTEAGDTSAASDAPPPPDPVDLDYAKQATDMVLDYLDETRDAPDQDLLEELKWSEQDLKQFSERWKDAREIAPSQSPDPERKRDLQEALESLGIRPPAQTTNRRKEAADTLGGLKDSGNRRPPPAAYRDAFESFRRAIGRQQP